VKELGRMKRKEKELETAMKYWLSVLEIDVTSLLGDTLGQQILEKENN
jgi:hypothetical protein